MNDGNSNLTSLISFYLIITIVGVSFLFFLLLLRVVSSCYFALVNQYAFSAEFIHIARKAFDSYLQSE